MVCIRCQKRPAIIFVQRMENGQMKNEGYCLHCARELHIKPVEDLMKQFGDLGVLGMHLEGYGCGGSSAVHYGLACLELEAVDSGIRSMVSVGDFVSNGRTPASIS